jgi:hypothetical protein
MGDRGVKLTTHFHLLGMRGTTHALLRASYRVAKLSTWTTLYYL